VRGVRDDGTVVVEGVIRLWVTDKPVQNTAVTTRQTTRG
jgi:hypothetical protein